MSDARPAILVAIFPKVYIENKYGGAIALGDIHLRKAHMPPHSLLVVGRDENAVGSSTDPCLGFIDDDTPRFIDANALGLQILMPQALLHSRGSLKLCH